MDIAENSVLYFLDYLKKALSEAVKSTLEITDPSI